MIVPVGGLAAHASTGGVELSGNNPVALLIHGAGMDASVWQLQTRYLAYHGVRAVAVDLPGHGRSAGPALASVEEIAEWLAQFVDAAGFESVHLVGHSMGTFIALQLACQVPQIVASITLCGTATGMPVHPELLAAAEGDVPAAAALMAAWGHAKRSFVATHPTPGLSMLGGARALVEISAPGVLATDFRACMAYSSAVGAAGRVSCPATVVIGLGDKMTPAKGGRSLAAALPAAHVIELAETGHSMMTERPRAVRQAILDTISRA